MGYRRRQRTSTVVKSSVFTTETMLLAACLATLMFGQLVVPATGQFTQGGSLVSLRPHNITGLRYELYGWTGSYVHTTTLTSFPSFHAKTK